jgi:8-oxo-dGTP pyrophosphatase MutT (NUDIX family)
VKGVAIDDTGRFLLAKESNGKWELLGGGLDHGEEPMACLKREVHEETGLVVAYVSPTPKYFISSRRLNHETYTANVIYEIKLQDLNFTASDECQELRYFNVQEAQAVELFPNVAEFIKVFDPKLHV